MRAGLSARMFSTLTSSFKFDTSKTLAKPRIVGAAVCRAPLFARAKAPRLGMPPLYPPDNGAPMPRANDGNTPGAPSPFTEKSYFVF